MTSSDAAECFAEARGHLGARPDRIWRPAQARTPSSRISQIWIFQDFQDLVLHTTHIHRYDQKSKDYVLPLSDIWEMRPGGATRYRYLHNTLTLQVRTLLKPLFFIVFIDFQWFSLILQYICISAKLHTIDLDDREGWHSLTRLNVSQRPEGT